MGSGGYSVTNRCVRTESYKTKSAAEIFPERDINSAMSPYKIGIRESRDSSEHPNSVAIIVGLDETGSMLTVPQFLIKEGLPHMMQKIIDSGISDPQVLFLGIGDHEYDRAPLQVGQFESSDELLDFWLTKVFLEGKGGGNDGESYSLAHLFAAKYTAIDCFEKRNQKGILITIGDEKTLTHYSSSMLKNLLGDDEYHDYSSSELMTMASEKYEIYHLHIKETRAGHDTSTIRDWNELLGDHLIVIESRDQVADKIAEIVVNCVKPVTTPIIGVEPKVSIPNML